MSTCRDGILDLARFYCRRRPPRDVRLGRHPDHVDPALTGPGRPDRVICFATPCGTAARRSPGMTSNAELAVSIRPRSASPASAAVRPKSPPQPGPPKGVARAAGRSFAQDDPFEAQALRGEIDAATPRRTAIHEAGDTVVAIALSVVRSTVVAVGSAGAFGRTVMLQRT